jgi:hypothetical protein
VYVELGGTATRGTDYTTTSLSFAGGTTFFLTIGVGELSAPVTVTPIFDELEEGDETVSFSLLPPQLAGHDYTVGVPDQAQIVILDYVDRIFKDSFEGPVAMTR